MALNEIAVDESHKMKELETFDSLTLKEQERLLNALEKKIYTHAIAHLYRLKKAAREEAERQRVATWVHTQASLSAQTALTPMLLNMVAGVASIAGGAYALNGSFNTKLPNQNDKIAGLLSNGSSGLSLFTKIPENSNAATQKSSEFRAEASRQKEQAAREQASELSQQLKQAEDALTQVKNNHHQAFAG